MDEVFKGFFLARFISQSFKYQLYDQFLRLEKGSILVLEYEATLHELFSHATMIFPIEEKRD